MASPLQRELRAEEVSRGRVAGFFSDLIQALHNEGGGTIKPASEVISNHARNGARVKLPYLIEIFLAGEEALSDEFYLRKPGRNNFSIGEAAACIEDVNRAFHALIEHYAPIFCENCLRPFMVARHHMSKLKKRAVCARRALQNKVRRKGAGHEQDLFPAGRVSA